MNAVKTDKFSLDQSTTEKLTLSYNFIERNKLVPLDIEDKALYYSTKFESIMSGFSASKPISKILDFNQVYDDNGDLK